MQQCHRTQHKVKIMTTDTADDVFKAARVNDRIVSIKVENETIPMLLRFGDVRSAAKNWQVFSSDTPFRVPIPSEEHLRSVRQIPIETDPPQHKVYRTLIEPFFRKPINPDYIERINRLVSQKILQVRTKSKIDIVREFALPIQSCTLTYLLGLPESEADTWMKWGTHVFRDGDDQIRKGAVLESYILDAIDSAYDQSKKTDFFSYLKFSTLEGRRLTQEEALGIANLVFAGGRDTVINAISFVVAYFAQNRKELNIVASNPKSTNSAVEEFIRVVSPLTHIGRVCKQSAKIGEAEFAKGKQISLCWASANFDHEVFTNPQQIDLQRFPNPHVGFGIGPHSCLGALHTRVILRSLIRNLAEKTDKISIETELSKVETYGDLKRNVGYEKLIGRFS